MKIYINDENFIKQMKCKNPKALDYVVDNYSGLVFKVVRHVLNSNDGKSEECVNDVFFALWQNIDCFDETRGSFKSYLATIAKYKAIDFKRKYYKDYLIDSIEEMDISSEYSIESSLVEKEAHENLMNALDNLKAEDKEIFVRKYFLGEKVESIAKFLGYDRNTIDKRLSRGRKALKEILLSKEGRGVL